jgi:hypothetical protein
MVGLGMVHTAALALIVEHECQEGVYVVYFVCCGLYCINSNVFLNTIEAGFSFMAYVNAFVINMFM